MPETKMSKADFETLADFRYRLRRFLRFSEEVTHQSGVRPLQYLLMLLNQKLIFLKIYQILLLN